MTSERLVSQGKNCLGKIDIQKRHQWQVMSDSTKENRPLLCDDVSDEEVHSFSPHQRRHIGYKGRAKSNIKGAAAIIKNWPDHLTSSVTYWWVGIGMFGMMVFFIYNSVIYAMLPSAYSKPVERQYTDSTNKLIPQKLSLPDVFIPVVINDDKEADLNKYLPYIEIFSNKFLQYNFNLILLYNDTLHERANPQAQLNNEEALNSLWTVNNIHDLDVIPSKKKTNVVIQYLNLSSYLNASPLRKIWKHLPYQLIEFMVRAASIWDKGGIAFNPVILTPRSPHAIYIEKLQNILRSYQQVQKINSTTENTEQNIQKADQKNNKKGHKHKNRKRVNNIRDVIDALDMDGGSQSQSEALSEAESRQEWTKIEMKPLVNELIIIGNSGELNSTNAKAIHNKSQNDKGKESMLENDENHFVNKNVTDQSFFLPLFLDFLFRDPEIAMHETTTEHISKRNLKGEPTDSPYKLENKDTIINRMIIPAPTLFDTSAKIKMEDGIQKTYEDEDKLTIDLKGNFISTRTSCHAFLGAVFSNVKHCTEEESVKDFIISELSRFCKGLLSTCKGIDVVLV